MPRIRTPNLDSAIRMVRSLDNLLPGPAFNNMIRTLNQSWGFADELGDISGKNGFWNDAGVAKIGTMPVPDFMRLSKKAKLDFLESDAFSPTARTRMGDAVNANFTSKFDDVARAGQDGLRKAKADMMEPNGRTVKNQPMFNQFMDKFGTAMKLTAAAALVTSARTVPITVVLPTWTIAEPSALPTAPRVMEVGRVSCKPLPSGRTRFARKRS